VVSRLLFLDLKLDGFLFFTFTIKSDKNYDQKKSQKIWNLTMIKILTNVIYSVNLKKDLTIHIV